MLTEEVVGLLTILVIAPVLVLVLNLVLVPLVCAEADLSAETIGLTQGPLGQIGTEFAVISSSSGIFLLPGDTVTSDLTILAESGGSWLTWLCCWFPICSKFLLSPF